MTCSSTLKALADSYIALRSLLDYIISRDSAGASVALARLRENLPLLSSGAAEAVSGVLADASGTGPSVNRVVSAMSRIRDAIVDEVLNECTP